MLHFYISDIIAVLFFQCFIRIDQEANHFYVEKHVNRHRSIPSLALIRPLLLYLMLLLMDQ